MSWQADLEIHEERGRVVFKVRVAPRAARAAITGVHARALKVALTSPPVDGAANRALIELLAEVFAVPQRAVQIVRGERSRNKAVSIEGVALARVRALLDATQ